MSTTTIDRDRFGHFLNAQDGGVWERALDELRRGAKTGHWMWFVFPQIAGLGSSEMARAFALANADEAAAYFAHPVLGHRLLEASQAMLGHASAMSAAEILGLVDTLKFRSSMTLFEAAVSGEDAHVFGAALDRFFDGKRDELTLARL